jgi:hypothetical protein
MSSAATRDRLWISLRSVSCITYTDRPVGALWLRGQPLSPSLGWPCGPDPRGGAVGAAFDPPQVAVLS